MLNHLCFAALFCLFLLNGCGNSSNSEKTQQLGPDNLFAADISEHYALISNMSGPAELWQLKPKSLLHSWKHLDGTNGIIKTSISGNEEFAITAERDSLVWWRISDGKLLKVWSFPEISAVSISSDGHFALIGLPDKAIYFSLKKGITLYAFRHEGSVLATDISKSGQYALTGSADKTAKLWDLATGELKYTWTHFNQLSSVAISPDDSYAFTNAALGQALLWKLSNGKIYKSLKPDRQTIATAKFSGNGRQLITGLTSGRIDLWNIKAGQRIKFWRAKKDEKRRPTVASVLGLAFIENDKKIYSIASNGYLQRWKN